MNIARVAVVAIALGCSACIGQPTGRAIQADAVTIEPHPWQTPAVAASDAKPQILQFWMNRTKIPSGVDWTGRAVTTTNVASLEIRTESFSFVAERTAFGSFRFSQHVLDMVPYYKRPYTLHVIARNAAGQEDELLVPIVFQ